MIGERLHKEAIHLSSTAESVGRDGKAFYDERASAARPADDATKAEIKAAGEALKAATDAGDAFTKAAKAVADACAALEAECVKLRRAENA